MNIDKTLPPAYHLMHCLYSNQQQHEEKAFKDSLDRIYQTCGLNHSRDAVEVYNTIMSTISPFQL